MANKGRAYPRLFERDFSIRNPNAVFTYLANQIVCRCSGAQWQVGWPTGVDIVSNPGVANYVDGIATWEWPPGPGADPNSFIRAELILTDNASYWRARWRYQQSASFYWTNEQTKYNTITPPAFPDVFGFPWISSSGVTTFILGIDNIRSATWADV